MSSKNLAARQKRLRFRDSDSDSDNEIEPPFKIRRKSDYRLPFAIKDKFRSLAVWIADLPISSFFAMAVNSTSSLERSAQNDGDDVQEMDSDDVIVERVLKHKPDAKIKSKQQSKYEKYIKKSAKYERNGSHSIRRDLYNPYGIYGSNFSNWNSVYKRNGDYNSSNSQTDGGKHTALVSRPPTSYEIMMGTEPKVPAPEADEIEILSESPSTKQKPVSSRKSIHASLPKTSTHRVDSAESSSAGRSQPSSSKGFTANEVVRLKDKEMYSLLIQQVSNGSLYKHQPPDNSRTFQKSSLPSHVHYKKEILDRPIENFIEKYFKPCQLVIPEDKKQNVEKEISEIKIDDEETDDELQVVEVILPKVKTNIRSKKFFSPEWLAELRANVHAQTEERMKIVENTERTLEQYRKQRLLKQLHVDAPPSQSVEPEFPELTPEMEEVVDNAFNTGAPNDVLCKITSDELLRKDIDTLDGLSWLNDLVINSYFDLIVARSKKEGYPSVHAFNTFFYSTYKTKGYSGVRRWTRKIDIFSFDLNFVPLHLGVHWCLAVIDHRSKKVCYYDSMGSGEERCVDLLHEYLCYEYKDKKGQVLDPSTYTTEIMKDIPQQMNGSDCGMFTLKYAEYISRDAEITFNQSHMVYFRRRMVYELIKCQLL